MTNKSPHLFRKWTGVIWLLIEVNLFAGTIFGFPALFPILQQYNIYNYTSDCSSSTKDAREGEESSCPNQQTRQYQVCS